MAEDKRIVVSDPSKPNDRGFTTLLILCLFVLLEAVALVSVVIWQEKSLEHFSDQIERENRLLLELENACSQQDSVKEEEVSRVKRQTLTDVFRDLLTLQEHVLTSVCQHNPHLCQFGPKGELGDAGSAGAPGINGGRGDVGPGGPRGQKGQRGHQGDTGHTGPLGPQGVKGDTGIQGPKGEKGNLGHKGDRGTKGPTGPEGYKGALGHKGQSGPQGPKGTVGTTGETGPKGQVGDKGARGHQGDRGRTGPKGVRLEGNCLCVDVPTVSGNFSDVMYVHLHQSLSLHCDGSDPQAKVTWHRTDNKPFTGSMTSSGSDIIFTAITSAEEGVYECVSSSTFGDVSKDVEIKLLALSPYDCDFEEDTCRWRNSADDKFDWTRISGPTPSRNTGPTVDHTLQTPEGHYLFIESSGIRVNGDNARLESLSLNPAQSYCLSFWYHLYGSSVGNVNVRILKNGITGDPIWKRSGPNVDEWKQATITIPPQTTPFSLIIEGVRGTSFNGDAAIDDIIVQESRCS